MDSLEAKVGLASCRELFSSGRSPYEPAQVRTLIREAIVQAGGGSFNPDKPFSNIVQPGMTVLLKPNWVLHENMSGKGMECMITHPVFIIETLRELLLARPGKIIIGDAPIQRANFPAIATEQLRKDLCSLAGAVPLEIVDFRRDVMGGGLRDLKGIPEVRVNNRDIDKFVEFDLKDESLLDNITQKTSKFRCTMYPPKVLEQKHSLGMHKYLLCREAFESDIIINLPKLKTHRKAGITAALKNLVGINGSKSYLPHHRIGGSFLGGDCYKGLAPLKRIAEFFLDLANNNINKKSQVYWLFIFEQIMRTQQIFFKDNELEGGWCGNDTVWRMVLDLNRLVRYGNIDGSLSGTPVRKIYSLTDGIIAGEGLGPLAPEPLNLGCVTFAHNSAFAEICHAALMHFDWTKIPLLQGAFGKFKYSLVTMRQSDLEVWCAGKRLKLEEVAAYYGLAFKPPMGWENYIEYNCHG